MKFLGPFLVICLMIVGLLEEGEAIKCHFGSEQWLDGKLIGINSRIKKNCPTDRSCHSIPTSGTRHTGTISLQCGPCSAGLSGCKTCGDDYCNDPSSAAGLRLSYLALIPTLIALLWQRI